MRTYMPSNEAPFKGILLLIFTSVAAGAILGVLTSIIAKWIYLVFLFPLLLGLGGGAAASWAVKKGKIRYPLLASVFAMIAGLIIYGTYTFTEYHSFMSEVEKAVMKEYDVEDPGAGTALANLFLSRQTGATGLWGYIKLVAKEGISISEVGSSSRPLVIKEPFSWVYLLVEMFLIAGIAAAIAWKTAKEPFCEKCGVWYGPAVIAGCVDAQASAGFLKALQLDDYQSAGEYVGGPDAPLPRCEVSVQRCPKCDNGDLALTVSEASYSRKNEIRRKELAKGMIHGEQFNLMTAAAEAKKSAVAGD